MAAPQTAQALRLLIVALAVSASIPRTAADAVISLGSTTMATTRALSALPAGSPAVTQMAGGDPGSCGVTATIQSADTVASIIAAYPALSSQSDLAALNPSMDLTQPLSVGKSICVGGTGSATWCNTPLTGSMCPTEAPGTSLVDWSTPKLSMTTPLNAALTLTPDLGAILNDPKTASSLFNFSGVQSLVMKVPATSAAARLVAANPGHPHIGLWLASGSLKPLIITIRPLWFSDSSAFYSFVPGSALGSLLAFPVTSSSMSWLSQSSASISPSLTQSAQSLSSAIGKRKLLSARKLLQGGNDPPAGGVRGSNCGTWCYGR